MYHKTFLRVSDTMLKKYSELIRNILIPLLVGGLVYLITASSIDYASLNNPPLAPPSFLFPIVWTILYVLMGVSYTLTEQNGMDNITKGVYILQLVLNALWSVIFFNLKWRLLAFIWILLLIAAVLCWIIRMIPYSKKAAYLQLPYLIWLVFAAYLSLGVYILNG